MKVCGQFHAPIALILEEEPPVPFAPKAVWALWRRQRSLASAGNLIPGPSSPLPATIPTKLSRLPEIIHSELMNTCHATVNWQLP
jgi:hypothetical protein